MSHDDPICPCEAVEHPRALVNPAGLEKIAYRVGDYASFRDALLAARPGEEALRGWHPTASGDLALQLLEWWAYVADVLTLYNERIASGAYLRTAELPEDVRRLVRLLGYRPRPGIGATGVVAALLKAKTELTLPAGFAIQSKPGPGEKPQIFETDAAITVAPTGALTGEIVADDALNGAKSVLVKGVLTSVRPLDRLVLLDRAWTGAADSDYAVAIVKAVTREKDPRGTTNTRLTFTASLSLPTGATTSGYRLVRSAQQTPLYAFPASDVLTTTAAHLSSISRGIAASDPILIRWSTEAKLVSVTSYAETIWYANADPKGKPDAPPPLTKEIPISIPHTVIGFTPALAKALPTVSAVTIDFGFRDVGELIGAPRTTLTGDFTLVPAEPIPEALLPAHDVLLEDANGQGIVATVKSVGAAGVALTLPKDRPVSLVAPVRVLHDLLPVSRGATVSREVLGSGDASRVGQAFTLQKSPLTYLPGRAPGFSETYHSTLRVLVDGIAWTEVPSFFGQAPDARVFVTREDDAQYTTLTFGDGVHGARLSSGRDNVVASYRHGSGAAAPAAGALATISKPFPGLGAVRAPVPPGRGEDPDPPAQLRRYAPRSVLAFGRAISGDDYETIAAQTPGVARARAYWEWDGAQQRATVKVYVGDAASALDAVNEALRSAADPNRAATVALAAPRVIHLACAVLVDERYDPDPVLAAVKVALLDPDTGLFGVRLATIGGSLYRSRIHEVCLRVPGVVAVRGLTLTGAAQQSGSRYHPGRDGYFVLPEENLTLAQEIAADVR